MIRVENCLKCGYKKYLLKNLVLNTQDSNYNNLFLKLTSNKDELFYLKICARCGFTEIYSAKIINEDKKKCEE